MKNNDLFVVFNALYVEGGSYNSVIIVPAESMESAVEKLGAKLEDQLDTGVWKLFVPAESYEPVTEEMIGSEEFPALARDIESGDWPGGAYAFYRAGVILHMANGRTLQEEGGWSYFAIVQAPTFLG